MSAPTTDQRSTPAPFTRATVADLAEFTRRVVAREPRLEDRVLRGAAYLASGRIARLDADRFRVQGTEAAAYTVDLHDASCTCPDWTSGRAPEWNGARWCKHLLGSLAVTALERVVTRRERAAMTTTATVIPFRPRVRRRLAGVRS